MSQASAPPQESFWAKHHDIIPIFIIAFMAVSFLVFWKHTPANYAEWKQTIWQTPAAWGRYEWGKYFMLPISNLLLFLYLLLSNVLPGLSQSLVERHEHISSALQSFSERSDEIAKRYREVKEKLETVDDEAKAIIERATNHAEAEKAQIIERAKVQAERIRKEADALGSQEVRRAQQELQAELIEKAFGHAQKLIADKITADDQNRINNDYLQQVGKLS